MQGAQEDCVNTDKRDCNWIGRCVPKNSPGLQFWEGDEAKAVCAQANAQCTVKYEKTLYGGKKEVVSGKDCESGGWRDNQIKICMAMGDCGPKINWVGASGYTSGYTYA